MPFRGVDPKSIFNWMHNQHLKAHAAINAGSVRELKDLVSHIYTASLSSSTVLDGRFVEPRPSILRRLCPFGSPFVAAIVSIVF